MSVIESRVKLQTLAALAKWQLDMKTPAKTRSELVRNCLENLLSIAVSAGEAQRIDKVEDAIEVLEVLGLGSAVSTNDLSEIKLSALKESYIADRLQSEAEKIAKLVDNEAEDQLSLAEFGEMLESMSRDIQDIEES
jgi:hypothetical protein